MKKAFVTITGFIFLTLFLTNLAAQKSSLDLYKSLITSPDSLKSRIYCDLADIYIDSSGDQSIMYSEKAVHFAKLYNNPSDLVNSNIILGSTYLTKGDYAKSLKAFETALELLKNSDDYDLLQITHNNIGIIYQYTQEYELSLNNYTIALNYAYKCNDSKRIIQSLTNIGNLYVMQGNYNLALTYYKNILAECNNKTEFSAEIGGIYNNIGYVFFKQNKLSEARNSYYSAMYYFDSLENTYCKATILNNLAEIEITEANYNEAEKLINQADSINIKMAYIESRKSLYYTTYQLFFKQSNYKKAIEYLNRYHSLKDSIYTKELDEKIKDIKTKYEVDKINLESKAKDTEIKQKNKINYILIVVLLSISILITLLFNLLKNKSALNKRLSNANTLLKLKDDEISANLQYARVIQNSCMINNQNDISLNYFILDLPKFTVGGDFYHLSTKENKTIIALADSTGHGISAGFLSVIGIELINRLTSTYSNTKTLLNELNTRYFDYITRSDTLKGESLSISIICIEKNKISYSGSKHKIWKYISAEEKLIEIKTNIEIIGYAKDTQFEENSFEVSKGDYIFLSSDGYPDQFKFQTKEKLKYQRFREYLKASAAMTPEESKDYLQNKLNEWKLDIEQTDDILVIGIKF